MKTKKIEFIESYIKFGSGDYKWNDNHGELIRCRNCIHWYGPDDGSPHSCDLDGYKRSANWYCAEGEREK